MSYTIDTDKLKEVGEEIKNISVDYNSIVNEMYTKINNITKDGTWESDSTTGAANQFVSAVTKDKDVTMNLATSLNSLGDKVVNYSNSINGCSDNKL